MVSVIFETYKSQHRRKIAKQRVHEQKALITAFAVLQDSPDEPPGRRDVDLARARRAPGTQTRRRARVARRRRSRRRRRAADVDDFLLTVDALKSGVSRVRDLTPLVTSRVAPGFGPIPEVTVEPEDGEAMVAEAKATLASVAQSRTLDACSRALARADPRRRRAPPRRVARLRRRRGHRGRRVRPRAERGGGVARGGGEAVEPRPRGSRRGADGAPSAEDGADSRARTGSTPRSPSSDSRRSLRAFPRGGFVARRPFASFD